MLPLYLLLTKHNSGDYVRAGPRTKWGNTVSKRQALSLSSFPPSTANHSITAPPKMPVPAPLSSFSHVPETQADLAWADLETVDLSNFDDPTAKQALAQQLIRAVRSKGFLYVKVSSGRLRELGRTRG